MARATRNAKLESRNARVALKAEHEPYWTTINKSLHLGYRKGLKGGAWIARIYLNGKYRKAKLAIADDLLDANGSTVLDYYQAQEKARDYLNSFAQNKNGIQDGSATVTDAINNYLHWYEVHRKAIQRTTHAMQTQILPALGNYRLNELTIIIIRQWHENLAKEAPRLRSIKGMPIKYAKFDGTPEEFRKRKATANRVLTVLKAALNHAWRDGLIANDEAWRRVKPFRNVNAPKISHLTVPECERVINACDPDFRNLVRAALLTGCRYGELIKLRARDFNLANQSLHIRETKNGKSRHVPLTDEGSNLFKQLTLGKLGDELVLQREDGTAWGTSHQARRLKEACKIAKIKPAISFHALRHTYGSLLACKGVSLQVIAELLGHSDTRITSRHYAHLLPSYVSNTLRANLPQFTELKQDKVVGIN